MSDEQFDDEFFHLEYPGEKLDDIEFVKALGISPETNTDNTAKETFLHMVPELIVHDEEGGADVISIQNIYPENMIYAGGHLLNILFTPEDRKILDDGNIHSVNEYEKNKDDEVIVNVGVKSPDFYADKEVTPLEGDVFRVISSLPVALGYDRVGAAFPENCYFDAYYIYKYLTMNRQNASTYSRRVPTDDVINSINECVSRLENTYIYCDYSNNKKGMKTIISERMLSLRFIDVKVNGRVKRIYQLKSSPALLDYAIRTGNLDSRNTSQIQVCTKYNRKMLDLQSFLFTCIMDFKNRGLTKGELYYSSIFRNCQIFYRDKETRRTEVKRDKDRIINNFFKKWKETGFIKDYKEEGSKTQVRTKIIVYL